MMQKTPQNNDVCNFLNFLPGTVSFEDYNRVSFHPGGVLIGFVCVFVCIAGKGKCILNSNSNDTLASHSPR